MVYKYQRAFKLSKNIHHKILTMHLALVNKLKECKTSDKTKPCYHTFCIDIRKGIQIEPFYWWPTLRSTNIRLYRQIDFYSTW